MVDSFLYYVRVIHTIGTQGIIDLGKTTRLFFKSQVVLKIIPDQTL